MANPELLQEIRARRDAGDKPQQIYEALQKKGWSTEDITGGLALVSLHATHFNVGEQLDEMEAVRRAREAHRNGVLLRLLALVLIVGAGTAAARTFGMAGMLSSFMSPFKTQPASQGSDAAPILINDYGVYGNYPTSSPEKPRYVPSAATPAARPATRTTAPAQSKPVQPSAPAEPTPYEPAPYTPAPAPSQNPPADGPPIYIPD